MGYCPHHFDLDILGVGSPASAVPAARGAELRGGVESRLTVVNIFGAGFAAIEISGCFKKCFSSG